jgi:hypothetical protein
MDMKIKLPPPPVHPKYPEESEAEARHWFNSHRAYALQAIRDALDAAASICDTAVNNAYRADLIQHADAAYNIGRAIRALKPELDDADR